MSESASSTVSGASGTSSNSDAGSPTTRCNYSVSLSTCPPERGGERDNFASTALWAVVLSTVFATVTLSIILCLVKRRLRRRSREQIRAFLWDMVRGVQNGTVEEAVLQRIIYGVDPEVLEQKEPIILETLLSSPTHSTNLTKIPSATSFRTMPFDREWKWRDLQPVSVTEPFSPSDPFGMDPPDTGPKPALLQLPWKVHSRVETEVSQESTNTSTSRVGTTTKLPVIERQLDAVFLIAMPQLRTPGPSPQAIVSLPVTLASTSPAFHEDYLHPIVPLRPKRILAIQRQQLPDPLSSTGRQIGSPGFSWFEDATEVRSTRHGPN